MIYIYNGNSVDAIVATHVLCAERYNVLMPDENKMILGIYDYPDYEYLKDNIDDIFSHKTSTVYIIDLFIPKDILISILEKCKCIVCFNGVNTSYTFRNDYNIISELSYAGYDITEYKQKYPYKSISKMAFEYMTNILHYSDNYHHSCPKYIDDLYQNISLHNGLDIIEVDADSPVLDILDLDNDISNKVLENIKSIGNCALKVQ